MSAFDIPLVFSRWERWSNRRALGLWQPGIYSLAQLTTPPDGQAAEVLVPEVIYFGIPEKPNRTIGDRLSAFHRTAILGGSGHSAGVTYREYFGSSEEKLYVAVCPVNIDDPTRRCAFIMFVERKLILSYVELWKKMPILNRK
jgi:hypothetical protein